MDDLLQILSLADRLAEARPLTVAGAGKLLGVALEPVPERSDDYSLTYAARDGALFERAELRLPGPRGNGPRQLLIVEVRRTGCLDLQAVRQRYGPGAFGAPDPRQPADAPSTLAYAHDWGVLTFAFAGADECLAEFVIDVPPPKAGRR